MNKYYVEILWGSKKGNPCATRKIVYADSHEEALEQVSARVREYKRFSKLHGGLANEYQYGGDYYSFVQDDLLTV